MRCRNTTPTASDGLRRELHKFGITTGKAVLRNPDVILESGSHRFGSPGEGPVHHLRLMATDARRRLGAGRKKSFCLSKEDIEQVLVCGHCVLDAHDKLHVRPLIQQTLIGETSGAVKM
jgi:hypothetical protein